MKRTYSHIVVGAGSAGCVLVERLTRDPRHSVLLLEAGDWDRDPMIALPFGVSELARKHKYEWGDESEPDRELDDRRLSVPHGKVIGGTSSINFMAAGRGHPGDYARWVAAGATGWSYHDVVPFFRECESNAAGEDVWRGGKGLLGIRAPHTPDPIARAFFDAAAALGYPATPDYMGERNEGFAPIQYCLRRGRRSSSAAAFLKPALKRPNLTVITRATATTLLFDGARVAGVRYERDGVTDEARAATRVVLSAGAINTPHLLMLSGIGPAAHLSAMGIVPRADLPVGQGLEDHLGTLAYWQRSAPGTFHRGMRADRLGVNMLRALTLRSGPAAELPGGVFGFVRSHPDVPQPDLQITIPSSAPDARPWFPGWRAPYADGFMIRAQLTGQQSRGEVLLRSADYRDRPCIVYNSLSHPDDLRALRAGVRLSLALGNSAALAPFRRAMVVPPQSLDSDEAVDAFIRGTAIQLYHPAASCRMGSGPDSVLDADLSVRGVPGLHVVDASAMPRLISGNPSVVIMMMAAKAASDWRAAG